MSVSYRHESIASLGDIETDCLRSSAMTIVNSDIYAVTSVKSDTKKQVLFHRYYNWLDGNGSYLCTPVVEKSGIDTIAYDCSSMTYYNHTFYIPLVHDTSLNLLPHIS